MSGKKWAAMVICALLCVFLVWAGLNVLVDPFNAFSDPLMSWDSYTQTLNPRNSKAVYITEHFDEFDSYIIGSSSAASYLPQTLDRYLDASFYNMFHYGADTKYDRELVEYLLNHDDVKYIVLVLGLNEANARESEEMYPNDYTYYKVSGENALSYYRRNLFATPNYAFEKLGSALKDTVLPQAFDVFVPENGTYDKRVREVESIGDLDAYLNLHSADFPINDAENTLKCMDAAIEDVRQIRDLCEEAGTELIVVLTPMSESQLCRYSDETINTYFAKLAEVTDYWNFAISPLTYDERYYYDAIHTRNELANMVIARVFDDPDTYYPDDFGVYCADGKAVTVDVLQQSSAGYGEESYTKNVPILMYHHLSENPGGYNIRPESFRRHMELLWENGYETVTFDDLIAFTEKGTPLPEKSVIITFDDGYTSNYEFAFPVLREYGFKATIFTIGCSVGHERYYKDTTFEMTPHFGKQEIDEMLASGLISVESHTYDMHQWPPFETDPVIRPNILPLEGESEQAYVDALSEDVRKQAQLFESLGMEPSNILAFPSGEHCMLANVVLKAYGYKVTVTTNPNRLNTIIAGLPQSLIDLGRMNIAEDTTDQAILEYLSRD